MVMLMKVEWEKTQYGYEAWVCRYGNIVTQSTISPEKCLKNHLVKLKSNGYNVEKIKERMEVPA